FPAAFDDPDIIRPGFENISHLSYFFKRSFNHHIEPYDFLVMELIFCQLDFNSIVLLPQIGTLQMLDLIQLRHPAELQHMEILMRAVVLYDKRLAFYLHFSPRDKAFLCEV